jgi:hypothetical protein
MAVVTDFVAISRIVPGLLCDKQNRKKLVLKEGIDIINVLAGENK